MTAGPSFIELSPGDADPDIRCDRGVSLVPVSERQSQAPDRSLLLVDHGSLVARCACWWTGTAIQEGRSIGVIGHYAAADAEGGRLLLSKACELLAGNGRTVAIGPMDGTTWRRYRFIVERGAEPPFALEPDNPDEWPGHWMEAGFTTLATYTSAINRAIGDHDPRTDTAVARLVEAGISIRSLDLSRMSFELERIYRLSLAAFAGNFLYSPIGQDEFMDQYRRVLPYVRPELVLLAERRDSLVGFMFALPDVEQVRRGAALDTIILKTLAVDPHERGLGLGTALLDLAQRAGHTLGFRNAIHALIHDTNVSARISSRYARTMRRYALFSRPLSS